MYNISRNAVPNDHVKFRDAEEKFCACPNTAYILSNLQQACGCQEIVLEAYFCAGSRKDVIKVGHVSAKVLAHSASDALGAQDGVFQSGHGHRWIWALMINLRFPPLPLHDEIPSNSRSQLSYMQCKLLGGWHSWLSQGSE